MGEDRAGHAAGSPYLVDLISAWLGKRREDLRMGGRHQEGRGEEREEDEGVEQARWDGRRGQKEESPLKRLKPRIEGFARERTSN